MNRVLLITTILLVVNQSFGAKVNITQKMNNSDGVLFRVNFEKKLHFTIPNECARLDYCEEIHDFPEEEIKELIDLLVARNIKFNQEVEAVESRRSDRNEGLDLCLSKTVLIRPKAVKYNKNWHLVLNTKDRLVQSFSAHRCTGEPNAACSKIVTFTRGYEGHCVQEYMNQPTIALSKNFDQVIALPMTVPSCCSCMAFSV